MLWSQIVLSLLCPSVQRVFTAAVQSGGNLELPHGWGDPVWYQKGKLCVTKDWKWEQKVSAICYCCVAELLRIRPFSGTYLQQYIFLKSLSTQCCLYTFPTADLQKTFIKLKFIKFLVCCLIIWCEVSSSQQKRFHFLTQIVFYSTTLDMHSSDIIY